MTRLAVVLVFCFAAAPAARACLNDREVVALEREFRSRYDSPATSSSRDLAGAREQTTWSYSGMTMAVLGLALAATSIRIGKRRFAKGKEGGPWENR